MQKLDERFINKYATELESKIIQHLTQDSGNWNLAKAHDYMKRTVDTLFGNERHSGIVQYLLEDQQHLKLTVEEAADRAEKLYAKGWSVKEKRGHFFLLDDNFSEVKDVTGSADIAPLEPLIEEFGIENAFMFLKENDLRRIIKYANKEGIDVNNIKSPEFTYEFILKREGPEGKDFPVAQMYKALGEIVRKTFYFDAPDEVGNLFDLYDEGYRIANVINPSNFTKLYLEKGNDKVVILPVGGEMLGNDSVDYLTYTFYDYIEEIFPEIEVEVPQMIGELGQVYAFSIPKLPDLINNQDLGEVVRLLNSMKLQYKQNNYPMYDKVMRVIVQLFVLNVIGIGNSSFTFANLGIDHIKPQVYLKFAGVFPLESQKILDRFYINAGDRVPEEKDALNVILVGADYNYLLDNFKTLLPYLDKDFIDSLDKYEGSKEIKTRIEKFKDFLEAMI